MGALSQMAAACRGAFDIDSGATKLQVSTVTAGKIIDTKFGQERPVSFGHALLTAGNGKLPETIMAKGLQTMRDLMTIGNAEGCTAYSAVATEVFRRAENGPAYLEHIQRELGMPVQIVTQDIEGQLGYATAQAYNGGHDEVPSWDSGGASFRIVSRDPSNGELCYYMGRLGTSIVCATLVENVRGENLVTGTEHINPVSMQEALTLIDELIRKIDPRPAWLDSTGGCITGIGGCNSIFALACDVRGQGNGAALTPDDIHAALEQCTGMSDQELQCYVDFEHADPARCIVPKLCLLCAVVRHLGIEAVRYQPAIGSCPGLLVSEEFW